MAGVPIREYDERLQVAKDRRLKYSEPNANESDGNQSLPEAEGKIEAQNV